MKYSSLWLGLCIGGLTFSWGGVAQSQSTIRISEFMAGNTDGLRDGNGNASDWIEIQNAGDAPVNLAGWYLTDDAAILTKWMFPSVQVTGGGALVVFASEMGVPDPQGALHTNFKLSQEGGYLALVRPDGVTRASEFAPAYPAQPDDVSYGTAQQTFTTTLVSNGSPARLLIPTSVSGGTLWTGGAEPFADGSWLSGSAAIGYDGVTLTSTQVVNVALRKPVIVPGETWSGLPKENLTDGLTTTFTHNLSQERTFYYMVDLGAPFALVNIELFNRADGCCPDRLNNYTVSIHADAGATPGPAVWSAHIRTNGSNSGVGGRDLIVPNLDPQGLFAGRWIRVQTRDNGSPRYLQIAELRANAVNWAAGAVVTADAPTPAGFPATNLVDGNLATMSHNLDPVPVFGYQLRLTQAVAFSRLEIWNRGDGCCPDRLSQYRVSVHLDAAGSLGVPVWSTDVRADGSNSGAGGVDVLAGALDPAGLFEGQWIRIQNLDSGSGRYLQIAEVRAFGTAGSSGYGPFIRRDVAAEMKGVNSSVWLRVPFQSSGEYQQLKLRVRYDDGFVAYLNGVEVLRRNVPAGTLTWNAAALAGRYAGLAEEFSLPPSALRDGANLLAIHAANSAANDRDFLFAPELMATRTVHGANGYFTAPTPGFVNSNANVAGFVADTQFSVRRGFFDAPFDVAIRSATPGASLVFTTNNSIPSLTNGVLVLPANGTSSPVATVHIATTTAVRAAAFKTGLEPSDVDTQTYLFLQDVIRQPSNPPGYPTAWSGSSADYAMDPKVVTNALYRDEIVADLRSIPTLSIVAPIPDLFGPTTGIYYNSEQVGDNWEREASLELILPDGSTGFQEHCGIRIWGTGWRPNSTTPKHSFQLKFKNRYGPGRLRYPFFPNAPVAEFDNIVLRAQGSRGWTDFRTPDVEQSQYIHDSWARDTAQAMGKLDGHATYVHLYLNGLYWGLYNPVEKTDEGFAEIYQGGDKSEYDVITRRGAPEVDAGTIDAWSQMMTVVNAGLATPEQYALVEQYLEIDEFIDYMMLHQYASNHDGPLSTLANNMRAIRRRAPGGQFRFHVWDMEYTFWYPQEYNLAFDMDQSPARIFQRLRANPEFRLRWADHVQKQLLAGGALTPGPAGARWQARAEEIVGAIVGESARWGDVRRNPPYTRNVEWTNELNRLLHEYFPVRTEILFHQYRQAGLYPNVVAPIFNQPGGDVSAGFAVRLDAPAGTVYYTLDQSDPRLPGGALAPGALAIRPTTSLVSSNSIVRLRVPADATLGTSWMLTGFNDAAWTAGPNAAGFEASNPSAAGNVPLTTAAADFSESARAVGLAIDGQPLTTGWGIYENQSYLPKGRGAVAVFETGTDVGFSAGTRLTFVLRHGVPGQLALGKFRLSATRDDRSQFANGLAARGDITADWIPLHPTSATAAAGTTVTILADGALLVGGANPTTNTYVVTVLTALTGITGFRLEALEDAAHPSNGPGRAGNGNAVLTDFAVTAAPAGIGHLADAGLAATIQGAMLDVNASVYLRIPFTVEAGLVPDRLLLRMQYEDGFVAYLNGQEIARRQAPAVVTWNSAAIADRDERLAFEPEEIDVSAFVGALVAGENVLAIHGLNEAPASRDALFRPELIAKTDLRLNVVDSLTVKARVLSGNEWSALSAATFNARSPLRFTEIMYDPPGDAGRSGDEFEFLEIQNVGGTPYSLSQFAFTSGINFVFPPGTLLGPGQYFLLARNPTAFASRYPGVTIHGIYTGRLDNQGETLAISRPFNGGVVLSLTYNNGASWPQAAAGHGFSLVPIDPLPGTQMSQAESWRASGVVGGSPGGADAVPSIPRILINEILTASSLPQIDWVELYNPTVLPANVGGWFLTDDPDVPKKYRLPTGQTIAPGGYLVLTEAQFNPAPGTSNSFNLSSRGESVFLFSGDAATNLTGYSHGLDFAAAADGVSFGRYINSVGEEQFPAQLTLSSNALNSGPRVGPVVLSEIQYHPGTSGDEFVELRNITGVAVPLYDPDHPTNTWRIGGLNYALPGGLVLPPQGLLLVVGIAPEIFRTKYDVPASVPIVGPYQATLQDSGERLELERPDVPDTNGVAYITVEAVRYNDRAPWPLLADGFGPSLRRRQLSGYGDDPTNWLASATSPGRIPPEGNAPVIVSLPVSRSVPRHGTASFAVGAVGTAPLSYQWRWYGTNLPAATNAALILNNVQPAQAGPYSVVVYNPVGSVESPGAILTVFQAATIVAQPVSVRVRPTSNAVFSVFATSTQPIQYQWRFNGALIPGATNAALQLTNVDLSHVGIYTVQIQDGVVSLESDPAMLTLLVNPLIVQQPVSQLVTPGSTVVLSVRVTNSATFPIGYRWRRGGAHYDHQLLQQTESFITLSNVTASTTVNVIVTNAANPLGYLSTGAVITVTADLDGDGLADEWETANGLNAGDPADAALDVDGDSMTAQAEYIAGTNPQDGTSYLKVLPAGVRSAALLFTAVSNRTYTVEFTDAVGTGAWTRLRDIAAGYVTRSESVVDASPSPTRVYRLVTPRRP